MHLFPSSVDVAHFARARQRLEEPHDQVDIPHPRLGFFGVIDERMDYRLVALRDDPVARLGEADAFLRHMSWDATWARMRDLIEGRSRAGLARLRRCALLLEGPAGGIPGEYAVRSSKELNRVAIKATGFGNSGITCAVSSTE